MAMTAERAPEYEQVDDPKNPHPEERKVMQDNEARQAVPVGRMRYVLTIGIILVVIGFLAVYFIERF
jgi:hypothetical protein